MAFVQQNRFGKITVTDNVIATIAGCAALEVLWAGGNGFPKAQDGIAELLGMEALRKGLTFIVPAAA